MSAVVAAYCGCGCGEITNARALEVARLRSKGLRTVEIADRLEITPSGVCLAERRAPAVFRPGHSSFARMTGEAVTWTCQRCGGTGRCAAGRPPPKFCQRHSCLASALPIWRGIRSSVQANQDNRVARLHQFLVTQRARLERRDRKARLNSPEARRRAREFATAVRQDELDAADRWLAEQSDDVRAMVLDRRELVDMYAVRLDAPRFDDGASNGYDRIAAGYNPRGSGVAWHDPVADSVAMLMEAEEERSQWEMDPVVGL